MSNEAQSRKDRSIAILKKEGVPILDHLPLIETEAESTRRNNEEVAGRAMALCFVSVKGDGVSQEIINSLIEEFKLESVLSPKEARFINDPDSSQDDRIQFSWRYECFWVLLWALGYIDALERPDAQCDATRACEILEKLGRDEFIKNAKLRSQAEILDAADLFYRYHWATVDARFNNREPPAGLVPGVVMERHYALNWLIGYQDQPWDEISTDT